MVKCENKLLYSQPGCEESDVPFSHYEINLRVPEHKNGRYAVLYEKLSPELQQDVLTRMALSVVLAILYIYKDPFRKKVNTARLKASGHLLATKWLPLSMTNWASGIWPAIIRVCSSLTMSFVPAMTNVFA